MPEIFHSCFLFIKAKIDSKDIYDQETEDLLLLNVFQTCFSRAKFFQFFEHLVAALAGVALDKNAIFLAEMPPPVLIAMFQLREAVFAMKGFPKPEINVSSSVPAVKRQKVSNRRFLCMKFDRELFRQKMLEFFS